MRLDQAQRASCRLTGRVRPAAKPCARPPAPDRRASRAWRWPGQLVASAIHRASCRRCHVGDGEPPGTFPSQPGMNMNNVGPDRNDPFPNRSYADIVTNVEEGPTGRIMFGVGATSYGGLNGNFILHESNFDITAVPKSWRELTNGQAFRAQAQDFRVELSPGTLVNRALVSFRDPYFLNLPGGYAMGLGLSGYAFSRFYNGQYNEYRGGGRFSLGSQFGTSTYADVALRVEDVRISDFYLPAPADFLAADGHTFLATSAPASGSITATTPSPPTRGSTSKRPSSRAGATSPSPSSPWKDASTSPSAAVRTARASASSPCEATSASQARIPRSTNGSTPATSAACEASPIAASARSSWVETSAVSSRRSARSSTSSPGRPTTSCSRSSSATSAPSSPSYEFTTFRASVGTGLRIYLPQQVFGPLPLAFDFAVPVSNGPRRPRAALHLLHRRVLVTISRTDPTGRQAAPLATVGILLIARLSTATG